jgi:hypothetical protein
MATTTPNFGWAVPTSTDLVKDGAVAIETLGDAIDARLGNIGTYPNQIVNVVSGVSRPIAYATQAGTASATYPTATTVSVAVTFTASRFTQAPLVVATVNSSTPAALLTTVKAISITTSGFTVRFDNPSSQTGTVGTSYYAIQMTSAASAG